MTSQQRCRTKRSVKGRDTKPEMEVQRLRRCMGYRYGLRRKDLPSKREIVFAPRRKVIFLHGCFWHGHSCKHGNRLPKTNADYCQAKIVRNVERHSHQLGKLTVNGWTVFTLWERELADQDPVPRRVSTVLDER